MAQTKWCRFNVVMPKSAFDILFLAYQDIERQIPLHSEEPVAWGRVIELLAADYLAGKLGMMIKTQKVTTPNQPSAPKISNNEENTPQKQF